jgi:hypothetical protein
MNHFISTQLSKKLPTSITFILGLDKTRPIVTHKFVKE